MTKSIRFVTQVFSVVAFATALTPLVNAGCGDTSQVQAPFVFAQASVDAQALAQRAESASRTAATANITGAPFNTATIVGMWSFKFISEGNTTHNPSIPDGALIDFGYTQWHSDGTELLNSGGRAPATENFCMGTWVRSGYFTYQLNHFALGYDPTTGILTTKSDIREQVILDPSGNEFAGTFSIDVYDATSGVKTDHLAGAVSAVRVTVDQTTP
jgi:hypothetical protein